MLTLTIGDILIRLAHLILFACKGVVGVILVLFGSLIEGCYYAAIVNLASPSINPSPHKLFYNFNVLALDLILWKFNVSLGGLGRSF
jgi:hypothetical protein